MRALVAEFHDGEAVDRRARPGRGFRLTGHHGERLAIADRTHHARGVVLPAKPGFDEVARHERDWLRVARLGEPDGDRPWRHGHIVPRSVIDFRPKGENQYGDGRTLPHRGDS